MSCPPSWLVVQRQSAALAGRFTKTALAGENSESGEVYVLGAIGNVAPRASPGAGPARQGHARRALTTTCGVAARLGRAGDRIASDRAPRTRTWSISSRALYPRGHAPARAGTLAGPRARPALQACARPGARTRSGARRGGSRGATDRRYRRRAGAGAGTGGAVRRSGGATGAERALRAAEATGPRRRRRGLRRERP